VKFTSVLLTVVISVLVQVALARYTVGGGLVFDFVLVGVMFAGLQWGPVAGMLAGTMGGLLQDVLAGEIVGLGGFAKTLVGFAGGVIGIQFVLSRAIARTGLVMGASLLHRLILLTMYGLIDQEWPAVSWGAMLAEMLVNGLAALVTFQVTAALPGVINRQRASRRSSLSRRQW
jgi:rod shape-determining protein MreD